MDAWMQPYRKMWKDSLNDWKASRGDAGLTSHMPQMKEGTPMYADLAAWFPTTVDGERKAGARLDRVRLGRRCRPHRAGSSRHLRNTESASGRKPRQSALRQDIPRPRRAWRISIISLSEPGHRLAHSMASSRDFTWIIQ